jgi:hypothetical protein
MVALSPIERGWFDQRRGAKCFLLGKSCGRSWEPLEASLAGLAREVAPASKERAAAATADEEKGFQGAKQVLASFTVSLAASPRRARRDQ